MVYCTYLVRVQTTFHFRYTIPRYMLGNAAPLVIKRSLKEHDRRRAIKLSRFLAGQTEKFNFKEQVRVITMNKIIKQKIARAKAHTDHLLNAFIELREKYALLEPMLINEKVQRERGSGRGARGFEILRYSLFLSCSQDIAKLVQDEDKRTPSLYNLIKILDDEKVCDELRRVFSDDKAPILMDEKDPAIIAALNRVHEQEVFDRRKEFDRYCSEARILWEDLSTKSVTMGFQVIRDKISAHTEIVYHLKQYHRVDIHSLGIRWSDVRLVIDEMQKLVGLLILLIRNVGFYWDSLDSHLSKASKGFWGISV